MSYTDLRDFDPEAMYEFPDGAKVEIEKLGGGTVGESYTGTWRYRHTDSDGVVEQGQDLEVGSPHTHAQVAKVVAEYFSEE
jgi:hypothetical protein